MSRGRLFSFLFLNVKYDRSHGPCLALLKQFVPLGAARSLQLEKTFKKQVRRVFVWRGNICFLGQMDYFSRGKL